MCDMVRVDNKWVGECLCDKCKQQMRNKNLLPVKDQLLQEPSVRDRIAIAICSDKTIPVYEIGVLPITHNIGWVELLFNGWSIKLYDDGTWRHIQDTSGG